MGRVPLLAMLLLVVAGCASTSSTLSDADRLALYEAHAGQPVGSFRFLGRLNGWTPLGDAALAVWTRPGEAWLLDLSGPCQDLEYANAISLTGQMNQVSARFDDVVPLGTGASLPPMPCRIQRIRPLDTKALKEAQRQLREARTEQRQEALR